MLAASMPGINPYQYAFNNPVMANDPSGQNPVLIGMAIGAAVGGVTGGIIAERNGGNFWGGFAIGAGVGAGIGAGAGYLYTTNSATGQFMRNVVDNKIMRTDPWYDHVPKKAFNSIKSSPIRGINGNMVDAVRNFSVNVIIHHGSTVHDGGAGGKLGGHVMINFGDDNTYGFTGWGVKGVDADGNVDYKQVPMKPTRDPGDPNRWFSNIHGSDYYGDMQLLGTGDILKEDPTTGQRKQVPGGMTTVFEIPVSETQLNQIKGWYESSLGQSPYPYTQFGKRCASSCYGELRNNGIIRSRGPLNAIFNAFNPGSLFRYLWRQGYPNKTYTQSGGIPASEAGEYNFYKLKY